MISFKDAPNNEKTFVEVKSANRLTEFGIRKAWFVSGKDILRSANKAVLARPRHGRVYRVKTASGRTRRHIASRPLESHANLSGRLRRSMQWKVSGMQLNFGYGIAKANAPDYAPFLENGTTRMEARPTLKNAIDENRRNIEQHLIQQVNAEFNK